MDFDMDIEQFKDIGFVNLKLVDFMWSLNNKSIWDLTSVS